MLEEAVFSAFFVSLFLSLLEDKSDEDDSLDDEEEVEDDEDVDFDPERASFL